MSSGERTCYTVGKLTREIRSLIENSFEPLWVEGEISNHRCPASGHHYFTLKDESAQLACVIFRNDAARSPLAWANGLKVQIFGELSVYELRGQYQFIARSIQLKGHGDLQARFELLKQKLRDEGLFDSERKKPIPRFPRRIGIVTSPTGAALQDALNVLQRRAPWANVVINPVRVQGEGADLEIAKAIEEFHSHDFSMPPVDVVLLIRGGGSIEDLWSFNEETVARALDTCSIPIISGVGHEVDFTIADFVADRREPTPSAAAENAVPDTPLLWERLSNNLAALELATSNRFQEQRRNLEALRRQISAQEPKKKVRNDMQTIDFLREKMERLVEAKLSSEQSRLVFAGRLLQGLHPETKIESNRTNLNEMKERLDRRVDRNLQVHRDKLVEWRHLADSLSPAATLERGFSMTLNTAGNPVTDAEELTEGEEIESHFAKGKVRSVVR